MIKNLRKISTQEEQDRKNDRNKKIIVVFLGLIMLFSTAGYFFSDILQQTEKPLKFNDVKFSKTDYGYWKFSYGGNSYETIYNPNDVANTTGSVTKRASTYYGSLLYISSDPIEDFPQSASSEVLKNLQSIILRYNPACVSNCEMDYPIKNCSEDNVIIFKQSTDNRSKISENEKCVILEYKEGESEKVADAFLFRILELQ